MDLQPYIHIPLSFPTHPQEPKVPSPTSQLGSVPPSLLQLQPTSGAQNINRSPRISSCSQEDREGFNKLCLISRNLSFPFCYFPNWGSVPLNLTLLPSWKVSQIHPVQPLGGS